MADPKFVNDIGGYDGEERPLTSLEVDGNFLALLLRVLELEEGGTFGLASYDFDGIHLTLNWTTGPPTVIQLPVATFRARGIWTNDQELNYLDVVKVVGVGTFLVRIPHTTPSFPAEFDPDATDGTTDDEPLYLEISDDADLTGYMLFRGVRVGATQYDAGDVFVDVDYGLFSVNELYTTPGTLDPLAEELTQLAGPRFAPYEELAATTKTLALADVGKVFRCPNGCDVTFPDDVDFPVSAEISFRQTGTDPVNFLEGGAVTINPQRDGYDTSTSYQGALVTAKFVSATEIDLIGPYGDEVT